MRVDKIDHGRIWNIAEQEFVVPEINYTCKFTSVHTDELAAGNDAPSHDNEIMMKMWDPTGTKCVTLVFDRAGAFVRSELDTGEPPAVTEAPTDDVEQAPLPRDGEPSMQNNAPEGQPADEQGLAGVV